VAAGALSAGHGETSCSHGAEGALGGDELGAEFLRRERDGVGEGMGRDAVDLGCLEADSNGGLGKLGHGVLRAGKKKLPAALPEGGAKGRDVVVPCASSLGKEAARSNRGRQPWLLGAPAPGEPGHGCPAQGRPGRRAPWEAPCSCAEKVRSPGGASARRREGTPGHGRIYALGKRRQRAHREVEAPWELEARLPARWLLRVGEERQGEKKVAAREKVRGGSEKLPSEHPYL
jgi:hypothetical protein